MPAVRMFEKGDKIYLVGPATVYEPSDQQMTEFAFIEDVRKMAPNPNLLWMHGQYVEADVPNGNKALWKSDELAIASLTPMFMPVNVMHDAPQTVGLIANVNLLTPEKDNIPRARIDTDLAIWRHLHPDIADECAMNAKQGTLMQSMECFAPAYTCSDCGEGFMKLPGGAEEDTWCAHLRGDGVEKAARILERVVFTGVGLIFGTRGREGADPHAYLSMEEVAARHQEAHEAAANKKQTPPAKTRTRSLITVDPVTISPTEYADLKNRSDQAKAAEERATAAEARVTALEGELTTEKAAHETTKDELDNKKTELTNLTTEKAAAEMKAARVGLLGDKFLESLPEDTRKRLLDEQATKLTDEEWAARITELAAFTKVEPGAKKDGTTGPAPAAPDVATQTADELASLHVETGGAGEGKVDQNTVLGDLAASL